MKWLPFVNLILFLGALTWIQSLEHGCPCSKDWRRTYMKAFYVASALFQLAILFGNVKAIKVLAYPVSVGSVFYLYATLTYINKMMNTACDCTAGTHRTMLFWVAIVQAFALAGSIFVGVRK